MPPDTTPQHTPVDIEREAWRLLADLAITHLDTAIDEDLRYTDEQWAAIRAKVPEIAYMLRRYAPGSAEPTPDLMAIGLTVEQEIRARAFELASDFCGGYSLQETALTAEDIAAYIRSGTIPPGDDETTTELDEAQREGAIELPDYLTVGGDEDGGVWLSCHHRDHPISGDLVAHYGGHGDPSDGLPHFGHRSLGGFVAAAHQHARTHGDTR